MTRLRGEQHKNNVLTKEAVLYIRANYKPYKKSYRFFANKYKVGESTIRDVVQYYTWYWV